MSPEERLVHRDREWARRLMASPKIRAVLLPLEAAAIIIDVTPGLLMAAIECGALAAERLPPDGGYAVRRGDLLDFIAAPRPIVQAVPAPAPSAEPVPRKRRQAT